MATFSSRLKEAMTLRNMKQSDLVRRTGIQKSAISQYLSDKYKPKQDNIYKLALALNVSEAWLMGHDTEMGRLMADNCRILSDLLGQIALILGNEAVDILRFFCMLNDVGKQKAIDTVEDLTAIDKYRSNDS